MKEYEIEFHFRYGNDEKDFDVVKVIAPSFLLAVEKLKETSPSIWIFKTVIKSEKEVK